MWAGFRHRYTIALSSPRWLHFLDAVASANRWEITVARPGGRSILGARSSRIICGNRRGAHCHVTHSILSQTSTMQVEPAQPLPVKGENDVWWDTEEDRASWLEFLEANKVRPRPAKPLRIPAHRSAHADVELRVHDG